MEEFGFGDIFYAIVSDRTAQQERMHLEPNYRIHRGIVLFTSPAYIYEGDERFLRNQTSLNTGIIGYARTKCFSALEDAQQYIDDQQQAEELVNEIL